MSRIASMFLRRCWKFEVVFRSLAGVWQEGENGGRELRMVLLMRLTPVRRCCKTFSAENILAFNERRTNGSVSSRLPKVENQSRAWSWTVLNRKMHV
jgi:hypothetical protein